MATRREDKVLSSWKEIAAYLGKGVRTVQRWEQQFGLPVSRPKNARKGVVIASTDKLDRWLATQWAPEPVTSRSPGGGNGVAASIRDHQRLRQANRELMFDLAQAMEGLRGESSQLARNFSRPAGTETRATDKQKSSSTSSPVRRRTSR